MNRRHALRTIGAALAGAALKPMFAETPNLQAQVMALIPDVASTGDATASNGLFRAGDKIVRVVRVPLANIREPRLTETVNESGNTTGLSIPCDASPSRDRVIVHNDGTQTVDKATDSTAPYCNVKKFSYLPSTGAGAVFADDGKDISDRNPVTINSGPVGITLMLTHVAGSPTVRPELQQELTLWGFSCGVQMPSYVTQYLQSTGSTRPAKMDDYQVVPAQTPAEPQRGIGGIITDIKERICSQGFALGPGPKGLSDTGIIK